MATTKYKQNGTPPDAALSEYVFGKEPPAAVELERAVLGALMIDREAWVMVSDLLRQEHFYDPRHEAIYRAMQMLVNANNPVDILTVGEVLRRNGELEKVGGSVYLVDLTNRVASSANIEYHARVIAQKWMRRKVIQAGNNAVRAGYDETLDDLDAITLAEKEVTAIWSGIRTGNTDTIGAAAMESLRAAEAAFRTGAPAGTPTGFPSVDAITGGLHPSDLTIIAARPGMGKTSYAMNIGYNVAKSGKPVAFFSLEMSKGQLATRQMASIAGVTGAKMRTAGITGAELEKLAIAANDLQTVPLYIDDTGGISLYELRSAARRMMMKYDIQLVVIDYLQLMSGTGERGKNRENEVAEISRGLKALAKELKVPVIALSQLSRALEVRGGAKRPQLSDLRESGGIEQDADNVQFIYRPEYYGILEDEKGASLEGIAEIINAKNRHGAIVSAFLGWKANTTTFFEIIPPAPGLLVDYSIPESARPNLNNDEDIPF